MSEFLINKARTVALTGHRIVSKNFNREKLKEIFLSLYDKGYDTFLNGMAIGYDTECFKILTQIKSNKDLRIIACIPCKSQSQKFNSEQKKEYENLLNLADEKIFVNQEYTNTCMKKRNEFMVDNASVLVAYQNRDFGGTANTVRYAQKNNVEIIFVE